MSPAVVNANGTATLGVVLTVAGVAPAGLEWAITYSPAQISGISMTAGPAASAAVKTLSCVYSPGLAHCLLTGLNANTMGSGQVASLNATIVSGTTAASIQISNPIGADAGGNALSVTSSGGGTIGVPALSSLACSPTALNAGAKSTCTVAMTQSAPAGGWVVGLASDNGLLTVPASVTVPAGAATAAFSATAGSTIASGQSGVVTATYGSGSQTATLILSAGPPVLQTISIDFVGLSTTLMSGSEVAGVIAKGNWNNASGAKSTTPIGLIGETGAAANATVAWSSDNVWNTGIADQAGNNRMMRGYLDTGNGNPTTVTVSGLASGTYDIYVYADGDNNGFPRSAVYQIGGPGVAGASQSATDAPNSQFSGTFVHASNSNGNYVVFSGVALSTGFILTATPGTTGSPPRAPVNGIQIVPASGGSPDFSISATPASGAIAPGGSTNYTVAIGALSGFTNTVSLAASGLPAGATASFSPAAITGSGASTLTITTTGSTPAGSSTLTITGTAGTLTHTSTTTLVVTAVTSRPAIGINFAGAGTTSMARSESAGVVAKANWNDAVGAIGLAALSLVDENGSATGATATWTSDNTWSTSIADVAGNNRMMRGYLDNGSGNPTTVTVAGLAAGAYDIYVYLDGDNSGYSHTGIYQISGLGVATTRISATDAQNTDFSGTFVQASNSSGNFVVFRGVTVVTGFTLTATPGATTGYPRAPVNGIQIVPASGG